MTRHQRCWVHKTADVLAKLPKAVQPKVKEALHDIWMADARDAAHKAFDSCVAQFDDKYGKARDIMEQAQIQWGLFVHQIRNISEARSINQ